MAVDITILYMFTTAYSVSHLFLSKLVRHHLHKIHFRVQGSQPLHYNIRSTYYEHYMTSIHILKTGLEEVINDRTPCIFGRLRSVCEVITRVLLTCNNRSVLVYVFY